MNTVEFLRAILAHDGWICIDIKLKKGFGHRFFRDFDQAAAYIHEQDAKGETVYFAISTFKEPTSRKQVNVAYVKAFIGDCDVGEGKPYKTRSEALSALNSFLATTSLPPPTVVHSGPNGLHLYWTLEEPLTPEQWRPRAEAFRALCKQHGFMLDHSRTADHSSVLRPIGTHNYKYPNSLVTIGELAPPSWVGDLSFSAQAPYHRPHEPVVAYPAGKAGLLIDDATIYTNVPSDAHKIAEGCAQIKALRDNKGIIPYDPWLYAIWTLHFTIQGDAIAHQWSSGHRRYSVEETQGKLDQATSPIKCATFSQHNDLCKTCQYWEKISTPLQLGRDVGREPVSHDAKPPNDEPSIYFNGDDGLWLRSEKTDKQGKVVPNNTLISKWPIYLDAICRSEREQRYSYMFRMVKPQIGEQSIVIPASVFFSNQGMAEMHGMGAVIHHADLMRDYVRKAVDTYEKDNVPHIQYNKFGWKDDNNAFLCGTKLYTQSQILTVTGSPEIERRARMLGPRGGSLQAWSAAANKLFAEGSEPQSFALCCSFGALLMHFISEEGGAIVNLVSAASATGKTTALEATASVWGELDALRLLDEDTQISRSIFLGVSGNLPCVFDELHKRDPDAIRTFVTVFTNGRDKRRGKIDGTLRDTDEWQTILIAASNISLIDVMQERNAEEAQAFRILELICDQTFKGAEGDKLRRDLMENRGWAGDAFLKHLMQPGMLQAVLADVDMVLKALWDQWYGFDARHRYWVRCFACALVAGRIVTHMGMLNFNAERVVAHVIKKCQQRANAEGKRDNVHILNEALYEIWSSVLVVDIEWRPRTACHVLNAPAQNKPFLARRVRDSGRMYITRAWLRKWLTDHGVDRDGFITDLKDRHVIISDSRFVTLGAGTDYSSGGQIQCVEIDMHNPAIMGLLEAAERDVPVEEKAKKPLADLLAKGVDVPSTLQ